MTEALLWVAGYLVGAGLASALRAFYIERPPATDWSGLIDWKFGNAMLPMIWPVYLPILAGHVVGSTARRVHALLNEDTSHD